jgi:hypothetical protein
MYAIGVLANTERPRRARVLRAAWWCALAAAVAVASAIPARAQSGDDTLIQITPRDSGQMMLRSMFGVVQKDAAVPEPTQGFARFVVWAHLANWNTAPVLTRGVQVLFGYFPTKPGSPSADFTYRVGDAPALQVRARWTCVPGSQGNYLYGAYARVPVRTIRAWTDTALVTITVAGVDYVLLRGGKRILSALVAHLPPDSATPAMVPSDTTLGFYYNFEVERAARPLYETMHPPRGTSGHKGEVVLGFIVDSTGKVEAGSFKVIHAPDSTLARATREAMRDLRHQPATVCGQPVAQYREDSFTYK